jgi:dihydrodipicolinate synthase/N-acetylneuraminate lyase
VVRLADAEHVVAIKWSVPPGDGHDYDDMREFAHLINVIDNSDQPVRCHRNGGRGHINMSIPVYPPHELEMWRTLEGFDYETAQTLFDKVEGPIREFMARAAKRSGGYRVLKGMMAVMGHPVGGPRPPTLPLADDEMLELRGLLASFGWPVDGTN